MSGLTEWQYVVEQFHKNFSDRADKRMAIYGLGKHTSAVLKEYGDSFNICALMDAEHCGETMWELPVIAPGELEEYRIDLIVIIARPSVIQIIYKRIADECTRLSIPVYDVSGNEIHIEEDSRVEDIEYFKRTKEELLDRIRQYRVISFDIYDTLLMRRVLYPVDVYLHIKEQMGDRLSFDFATVRKEAEQNLKASSVPNIYEIYDEIRRITGISDELAEELRTAEITAEKALTVPRETMKEVLDACRAEGKKVIILSDMYLTSNILGEILGDCGITGYDELIVSCEHGCTKQTGLAGELLRFGHSEEILHIGDNVKADIEPLSVLGIDTYRIYSAPDMIGCSYMKHVLEYTDSFYHRCIIAIAASYLFNDPFALAHSKGRLQILDHAQLNAVIAPVVIAQMFWMINSMMKSGESVSDMLFVARDGFLPQQIYRMIRAQYGLDNLPVGKYVLMSGRAATMACIDSVDDIRPKLQEYKGSRENLYKDILDIEDVGADNDDERILASARGEREEYLKYLDSLDINLESAVFYQDFFSKGTGQDNLENMLGRHITGCYLNKATSGIERRNHLDCISLFKAENHYTDNYNIFKYYSLIEYIYSAPVPCLKKIVDCAPIYFPEDRAESGLRFMEAMQAETLKFVGVLLIALGRYFPELGDAKMEDVLLGVLGDSDIKDGLIGDITTFEWFRGAIKGSGKVS